MYVQMFMPVYITQTHTTIAAEIFQSDVNYGPSAPAAISGPSVILKRTDECCNMYCIRKRSLYGIRAQGFLANDESVVESDR